MKKIRDRNKILIAIGIFVVIFIALMQYDYMKTGGIPDTLCQCVLGVSGLIGSFSGIITIADTIAGIKRNNKDETYEDNWRYEQ